MGTGINAGVLMWMVCPFPTTRAVGGSTRFDKDCRKASIFYHLHGYTSEGATSEVDMTPNCTLSSKASLENFKFAFGVDLSKASAQIYGPMVISTISLTCGPQTFAVRTNGHGLHNLWRSDFILGWMNIHLPPILMFWGLSWGFLKFPGFTRASPVLGF